MRVGYGAMTLPQTLSQKAHSARRMGTSREVSISSLTYEGENEHPKESEIGRIPKLIQANRHLQVDAGGLCLIGAHDTIPPRKIESAL